MKKIDMPVTKIRVVAQKMKDVKKVVVEIAAAVMFTIFAVPVAEAAPTEAPEGARVEIIERTETTVAEMPVIGQTLSRTKIFEATDKALEELRSRIGDTSAIDSQVYRLAGVLEGVDFYGVQLDAAAGESALNYMLFLPDLTQISINSLPDTLEQDVVAVNIFKHRKRVLGDFMTLEQLRQILLA